MKWAVAVLLVLGLFAAGSAALLFEWVQASKVKVTAQATAADVVLAQEDLPARTRLVAEHLKVEQVPRAGLPAGCLTNQAQAIGRTLKLAVVRGQPLTAACFLPETAIDDLLRPGSLAFQVPLPRRSSGADLLYPGCIVDVFATFTLQNRQKGDAVTTPLLQNIQVLAVRDETVITAAAEQDKGGSLLSNKASALSGELSVTLAVTARQAAALNLAMERSTLGLAMRNPLDKNLNPTDPMVVKEGQLTASSEALDAQTLTLVSELQRMLGNRPLPDANAPAAPVVPAEPNAPGFESLVALGPRSSTWDMTIIRAQKVEEVQLKDNQPPDAERRFAPGAPPADANETPAAR